MTEFLFNAYADPAWLPLLATVTSAVALIAVFYAQMLPVRVLVLYRFHRWISARAVLLTGVGLGVVSYFGYTLFDLWVQCAVAAITCIGLHRSVSIKSIRWININFALFMLFVAALYAYINVLASEIVSVFFTEHDLYPWRIDYKAFFKVFNPAHDVLFKSYYEFDGIRVDVSSDVDHLRSAPFLSGCVAFVSCFWSVVYMHVMRKHGFGALKAQALKS